MSRKIDRLDNRLFVRDHGMTEAQYFEMLWQEEKAAQDRHHYEEWMKENEYE